MSPGRTVVMTRRDRMVAAVSNFLFRFASPDYRAFVSGAVKYGMDSAARDDHEGRPAPEPWTRHNHECGPDTCGFTTFDERMAILEALDQDEPSYEGNGPMGY